ncbi:MAG: hypothetical protein IJ415_04070, partial [Clostridia bacterium]|nr:hypothetical protein [Clostridia bacterium]
AIIQQNMRELFTAFHRIPEKNRTIAYGIMALFKNLFYFVFKVIVGIVFKNPLLIAIALYNLLIGLVKANCSRGLWKNKDDLKDCKTYVRGGVILFVSSIFYIIYTANQVGNPYGVKYNIFIALCIAVFATYSITVSIIGLFRTKGKTMLIKEYKFTNFATALTNIVLTQMAILSLSPVENMNFYNSLLGIIVGIVILGFALYLIIHGLLQLRVYTTGITNAKQNKKDN